MGDDISTKVKVNYVWLVDNIIIKLTTGRNVRVKIDLPTNEDVELTSLLILPGVNLVDGCTFVGETKNVYIENALDHEVKISKGTIIGTARGLK